MSDHPNSNARDSTPTEDSTVLGPPDEDVEETSWEMRRTVADERRQHLLRSLAEHGDSITVSELAERVARFRTDDPDEPTSTAVERERTHLRRVDLPQLDDAGYLSYDADDSEVSLPGRPDREYASVRTDADD